MSRKRALVLSVFVLFAIAGAAWILSREPGSSGFPVSGDHVSGDRIEEHPSVEAQDEDATNTGAGAANSGEVAAPSTREQLHIVDEILRTRNDNDPRLDRELADLSPQARESLRGRYRDTPDEKRNELGTLVFLLGRDPQSQEDMDFLGSVLSESPCMSLTDCSKPDEPGDPHHSGTAEKTLAYPQLVALHSAARILESDSPWKASAAALIRRAMKSPIPAVAQTARKLATRHLP